MMDLYLSQRYRSDFDNHETNFQLGMYARIFRVIWGPICLFLVSRGVFRDHGVGNMGSFCRVLWGPNFKLNLY